MQTYPESEQAVQNLLKNRQWLGEKLGLESGESWHTPPAPHYPHIYKWDSELAAIINARDGGRRWQRTAKNELYILTDGIQPDGFIANQQLTPGSREWDPEIIVAFGKGARSSNYTQPPLLPLAVSETMSSLHARYPADATAFNTNIYKPTKQNMLYYGLRRSNNADDPLIGVIHPHETGRDSDPTFDFIKPLRIPRNGVDTHPTKDLVNVPIDYSSILWHGLKLRMAGEKRARNIFWVNDVMMNCMYADNLYEMEKVAGPWRNRDGEYFKELAGLVEEQILDRMWDPSARDGKGAFYALDKDGQHIKEISVSNLFPLVLPNLREEQLESLLDLMDSSFNTPYPLPSVATDSPNYDPFNREIDRLWRGPVWMNMNFYVTERGLKMQMRRKDLSHRQDLLERCWEWEGKIIDSSNRLLLINDMPYEHYNPITGEGQRKRVKNFAWSNLGYVMLKST